jgi:WD40 repeat protein
MHFLRDLSLALVAAALSSGATGVNQISLWDREGKLLRAFALKAAPQSVAISADNRRALMGCGEYLRRGNDFVKKDNRLVATNCTVHLLDLEEPREPACFEGHTQFVTQVAFSPNGDFGLSCGSTGQVRLWDLKTRKPVVPGTRQGKGSTKTLHGSASRFGNR